MCKASVKKKDSTWFPFYRQAVKTPPPIIWWTNTRTMRSVIESYQPAAAPQQKPFSPSSDNRFWSSALPFPCSQLLFLPLELPVIKAALKPNTCRETVWSTLSVWAEDISCHHASSLDSLNSSAFPDETHLYSVTGALFPWWQIIP